ncbi:MAG: OmpA family protein [Polyangiales bacterium]
MTQAFLRVASFLIFMMPALAFAQTQGFFVDRFDVSERGSDWFVGDSLDLRGKVRPSLGVVLDYAYKPLVLYWPNDGEERAPIIRDRLFANIGGSLVLFDRVRLAFNVPIALVTEGESARVLDSTIAAQSGASLGDLRFGADLRLLGEYGDPATLAIGAQLYVPTGDRQAFTGDGKVRVSPHVSVAGQIGIFDYTARVALNYRAQNDRVAGVPVGTELGFAATAGLTAFHRLLLIGPELWGSTVLVDDAAFKKATTPLELLLGVHVRPRNFRAGLGAGPGLSKGLGSPTLRVVAMFEWSPSVDRDRDGDGIYDQDDACPDEPGPPNADPARYGCPVADRDLDGFADDVDACPDVPGVASSDPAKNGCPWPSDRDHDGIVDEADACPDVPGLPSKDPKSNGCPDGDGDGIVDHLDACPTIPGEPNADPAKHGCPLARIEKNEIVITQRIEFEFDSAKLDKSSFGVLVAVLNIMKEHTEAGVVLVEGHTDHIGTPEYNKQLSERRAVSVRKWLIEHGVDEKRLLDAGFGRDRPLDNNGTSEGRQRNRRVEFHIIERDGKRIEQ